MRLLPRLLPSLLITTLLVISPARADEGFAGSLSEQAQPLLKAISMLGTPYKYGGKTPEEGLDCSGFVKYVYRETAAFSLPHDASEMSKLGDPVTKSSLEPGDLVFFNTRKRPNSHVGIYAGNGEFIHASSTRSKRVMKSRLDQHYWATRFNGARRILPSAFSSQ